MDKFPDIFEKIYEKIKDFITTKNLDECEANKKIIYINNRVIDSLLDDSEYTLTELCEGRYIDGNFKRSGHLFYPYANLLDFIATLITNNVYFDGNYFLDDIYCIDYVGVNKEICIKIFNLLNDNYLIRNYDFIYRSYFCVEILEIIEKYITIDYDRLIKKLFKYGRKFINEYNYCLNKQHDLSCVNIDDMVTNTDSIKHDSINILIEKGLNMRIINCNSQQQIININDIVNIINSMQIKYINIIDRINLTNRQFAIFLLKVDVDKLDLLLSDNKIIVCDHEQQFKELKSDREKLCEKYNVNTFTVFTSLAQSQLQPYYVD